MCASLEALEAARSARDVLPLAAFSGRGQPLRLDGQEPFAARSAHAVDDHTPIVSGPNHEIDPRAIAVLVVLGILHLKKYGR